MKNYSTRRPTMKGVLPGPLEFPTSGVFAGTVKSGPYEHRKEI